MEAKKRKRVGEAFDDEAPAVRSLFEEKYVEWCPPQFRTVGGLRIFAAELLCQVYSGHATTKENQAEADELTHNENFLTFMFLYLRSSSPAPTIDDALPSPQSTSSKRQRMQAALSEVVTKQLVDGLKMGGGSKTIPVPLFMVMIFFLELLQRLLALAKNQSPIDASCVKIISHLPNVKITHHSAEEIATGIEYMHPICSACEDILKTHQHPTLIPAVLQVLAAQRFLLICSYQSQSFHSGRGRRSRFRMDIVKNVLIEELFARILDCVYPLFLHPDEKIQNAAKRYLSGDLQEQLMHVADHFFSKTAKIDFSRLTAEDATLLVVSEKVLMSTAPEPQSTVDYLVEPLMDLIQRIGDAPSLRNLKVPLFHCLKTALTCNFLKDENLSRLIPILFSHMLLPEEQSMKSLTEITSKRLIRLHPNHKFDLDALPVELRDPLQTAINAETACRPYLQTKKREKEEVDLRTLSEHILNIQFSSQSCMPEDAAGALIPFLVGDIGRKSADWRTREAMIVMAGSMTEGLRYFAKGFLIDLHTILGHIISALQDPVDAVKATACWVVKCYYEAIATDHLSYRMTEIGIEALLPIYLQLAIESSSDDVSTAAINALTDFIEAEMLNPCFPAIIRAIEKSIKHVRGERLLALLDLVDLVTSEAKDSGVSCPPNHIPELLMKELAAVADKEDEESRRHTEILLTGFAAYESDHLKKLAPQLFPICHRLAAKETYAPRFSSAIGCAICDIFVMASDNEHPLNLDENYKQFVLQALKYKNMLTSLFAFLGDAFVMHPSLFQPILPDCFRVLFPALSFTEVSIANNAVSALAGAFRVFDLTEKQISSFLSSVAANALLKTDAGLINSVGIATGMCGIRHASFMLDINNALLQCMLRVTQQRGAITDQTKLEEFLIGCGNLWANLLTSDKPRDASWMAILRAAAPKLKILWLGRPELVERMKQLLAE